MADWTTERQIGHAISQYLDGQLTQAAFRVRIERLVAEDPCVLIRLRDVYVGDAVREGLHEHVPVVEDAGRPVNRLKSPYEMRDHGDSFAGPDS